MKEGAPGGLKLGLFILPFVISVISAQSYQDLRNVSQPNQNNLANDNSTGELMKRAGEFASRVLWLNKKKRKFMFPKGTVLTLTPQITVPGFRQKAFKGSLNADMQISWVLYAYLDKMGLTDEWHIFPFDRPPFYPFGPIMRCIGDDCNKKEETTKKPMKKKDEEEMESKEETDDDDDKGKTVKSNLFPYGHFPFLLHQQAGAGGIYPGIRSRTRKPRSVMALPPPEMSHPGGERALILPGVENLLAGIGFEGRGCMLRVICELHDIRYPMQRGYGLLGEMITLFFSISKSPYADSHMPEYLKAEMAGRAGNCAEFTKLCAKSIFKWETEKRRLDELENNEVPNSQYRYKTMEREL